MTVIVDQDAGGGAGQCVVVAPEVFNQRDEEDTVMLQQPPPARRGERSVRWPGGGPARRSSWTSRDLGLR
jgi:ferredoxin